ncbi:MAG TPA: nucleoside 2-deoxyribosyltransferase [Vicinamibacterales bacterium]|jgi:nucleoside 2-deoxyribosyltransferase|nr:nucleoside 2-deoxyribosyltransferase [Vicinamibacterales bacterium]
MRIYLACTVRGERSGVLAGRAICQRLQQLGHEVLTTHLLAEDVESAEAQLTEEQVYRRDIDWLSQCDVLVAEASGSSYGVGFEVGYLIGRARETDSGCCWSTMRPGVMRCPAWLVATATTRVPRSRTIQSKI